MLFSRVGIRDTSGPLRKDFQSKGRSKHEEAQKGFTCVSRFVCDCEHTYLTNLG